ncbi:phosphodiester glycosidase family protein [uncultured Treponema sp.]|uniref:phosphodiester glycosidase family protein n=1 Tax=uncultured Treponema sp. TaxID=162155 RepID=UPI0025DC277F|nr:phosphodiester glycosidase family protein [uncultured Treponema sp.]
MISKRLKFPKNDSTKAFLNFFIAISVLQIFILASCGTNHAIVPSSEYADRAENLYIPAENELSWQKIENCDFAEYFFYENKSYPVRYHCVKIDLNKEVSITTFPQSEKDFVHKNGKNLNYFTGLRAAKFSKKFKSKITINAAPFGGKNGKWDSIAKITSPRRICGIHVVNKEELAPPIDRYSALCFSKDENGWTAKIIKNQKDTDFTEFDFAFGGFFTILSSDQKEEFSWKSNDSRTAAGITSDGKTLFLLVVEGERWSKSHGLSYQECADIMHALGAETAMQMDGGGSSSLFINQKNALSYPALRKNAVFIGFY